MKKLNDRRRQTLQLAACVMMGMTGCIDSTTTAPPVSSHVVTTTSAPLTANGTYDRALDPGASNAGVGTTEIRVPVPVTASAPAGDAPDVEATLSDGQIVAIGADVDQAEIAAGRLAMSRAKSAEVRKFAQHMVVAHTSSDMKLLSLARTDHLTLADSLIGTKLNRDAEAAAQSLMAQPSGDFDHSYIAGQINAHEQVLDLLDTKLIPNAHDPQLRSALESTRAMVVDHIRMAKDAQASASQR